MPEISRTASIAALTLLPSLTVLTIATAAPNERGPTMDCDRLHGDAGAAAAIDETLQAWAGAIRAGDVTALVELVTEDAEFWTHARPPLVGRPAVAAGFESIFARFAMEQEFLCDELIVAGEWAFLRGTESNTLTPADGGDAVHLRQRAFSVLHRGSDGTWRFTRGMTNLPGNSP